MFKDPELSPFSENHPADAQINNYTVGELSYTELHVKLFLLVAIFFPLYSSLDYFLMRIVSKEI